VLTSRADPAHHTRLPRYARGAVGTVVEMQGRHPLPDLRSRRLPAEPEPVYTVAFAASELFGDGDHTVTVDLWHSYLRPAEDATAGRPAPAGPPATAGPSGVAGSSGMAGPPVTAGNGEEER
jgi:nitrile hydratase